jgi:hypothetical protein
MMEAESSLQTLAEVSVALAGFSSLLVVLRRGPAGALSEGEGTDLFVVVGGNLLVVVYSLFPFSLHHLGVSEFSTWRIASALLAVALLLGYLAILRLYAGFRGAGSQPSFPRVSRIAVHTPIILLILLVIICTGLFGDRTSGAYLLALLLLLSVSSIPLLLLVIELATSSRE